MSARVVRGQLDVTREADLVKRRWSFHYAEGEHVLSLCSYEEQARETRRHKFRAHRAWSHLDTRSRRPFIPTEIAEEALQAFRGSLTVEMT